MDHTLRRLPVMSWMGCTRKNIRSSGRRAVVKPCGVITTTFTTVEDDKSQWRHKEGRSSTIVNLEEI